MSKLMTIEQVNAIISESEKNAIIRINDSINNKVLFVFGRKKQYNPIQISVIPTIDEFTTIAFNYQTYIATNPDIRRNIMVKVNFNNLQNWKETLEPAKQHLKSIANSFDVTFPDFYFIKKSVIYPKQIDFNSLIAFLNSHFGNDTLFPTFSFEDAAVILFIKPIYGWFYEFQPNYQKEISSYINYLAFAIKVIIEKMKNVKIDPFSNDTKIKTYSAYQNILVFLNKACL